METNNGSVEFHLPVRPYSPIDAHNRAAAAKGSPMYAQLSAYADYNGHNVTLSWNSYRSYYVAEYFWAGRTVIARGDFATCLKAVLAEYDRGALGASASIVVPANDEVSLAAARLESRLVAGSLWTRTETGSELNRGTWWTWRHQAGNDSAKDMANPGMLVLIFDWDLCKSADNREAYEQAVKVKYGRVYT